MTSQYYRDYLLDQLQNLRQDHMSIQDHIAIFKDLAYLSDVKEHHFETIIRFVWSLRPKIRRAMITGSYDLDTVEEVFDVALKIDLTFKTLVNVKARCSKYEGYEHYDYQCPSKSQHVGAVPSDDVDDSKVIEGVHVSSKTANIIEDITVDFGTLIFDEVHVSSDSTSDDENKIVKSNKPTVPSKSLEFLCAEYSFMVVLIESCSSESPKFLTII